MGRKKCPLLLAIRKAILPLNNSLLSNLGCIWVTAEELHERLVRAGVCKTLKLSFVVDALRLYNPDCCFMAKTVHNSVNYYRSKSSHLSDITNSCPGVQRFKHGVSNRRNRMQKCIQNYFVRNGSDFFDIIKESLAKIEQKETERIEDERRGYMLNHSLCFSNNECHSHTIEASTKMLP